MIFKRFIDNFISEYPEDLKKIRDYLEGIGELKCSDRKLDMLWRDFSDECYCASFLSPDNDTLERFANWLEIRQCRIED